MDEERATNWWTILWSTSWMVWWDCYRRVIGSCVNVNMSQFVEWILNADWIHFMARTCSKGSLYLNCFPELLNWIYIVSRKGFNNIFLLCVAHNSVSWRYCGPHQMGCKSSTDSEYNFFVAEIYMNRHIANIITAISSIGEEINTNLSYIKSLYLLHHLLLILFLDHHSTPLVDVRLPPDQGNLSYQ